MSEGHVWSEATLVAKSPKTEKSAKITKQNQEPTDPKTTTLGNRAKVKLSWERINSVTHKLVVDGRVSHTPASHGQWQGYHTSFAVAWVMNADPHMGADGWVGRCRDKRGDWCLGPTTLEDAKRETRNWVLGLPVGGKADEWFLSNPIREFNELTTKEF